MKRKHEIPFQGNANAAKEVYVLQVTRFLDDEGQDARAAEATRRRRSRRPKASFADPMRAFSSEQAAKAAVLQVQKEFVSQRVGDMETSGDEASKARALEIDGMPPEEAYEAAVVGKFVNCLMEIRLQKVALEE